MAYRQQCNVDEGFYHQIQREELRYHVDGQEYSSNGIRPSNEPLVAINYSQDDPTIERRRCLIDQILQFS